MMTFVLVIHSIACVLLVLTVLMQAGRGGGLTEAFSSAENVFGAQTSSFMVRATSILAAVFFVTSLSLAFLSSHQERSLMAVEKGKAKQAVTKSSKNTEDGLKETVTQNAVNAVEPIVNQENAALPAAVNAQQ